MALIFFLKNNVIPLTINVTTFIIKVDNTQGRKRK